MPVTYRIDKERGIIHTRCEGNTTFVEVIDHFRTLEQDPDCPSRLDALVNLTDMTTVPTSPQLRVVSEEIGRVRPRVRGLEEAEAWLETKRAEARS